MQVALIIKTSPFIAPGAKEYTTRNEIGKRLVIIRKASYNKKGKRNRSRHYKNKLTKF